MKTSKTVAKLLFVVGALVYLVGLWILMPIVKWKRLFSWRVNDSNFGNYVHIRAEKLGQLDDFLPISAS